ncbi:hypothetical protein PFICI_02659 [Pestalotiopsis fici W106-1]|uniref:NAD(P)-binding protein n=1 Tax=Pestalotiopsis fici (strain W106-1 / CGMCC3.15140) TaxID=1229662 RepID=W3XF41_PESFW|nr:uncharacterized protein PFICI_02659 [Pestalotiopsis fici W106-1]ETS84634.1 hypothetical protein PFICI_02659 [Pestalotiopsis fici W106-1]
MDEFSIKGKTAVITGGARGLGFAFADILSEAGANIAILDVGTPKEGSLESLSEKYGVKVNVNAAGVVTDESFLTTSDKNLASTFNVNFIGSFLVAQACGNAMVRKWEKLGKPKPADSASMGSIIFIGSVATHISTYVQQITCYTASKAAICGLVKPMAMELAQYGIRVNSLSPGSMRTDMFLQVEKVFPDLTKQFNQESMFGRVGYPKELGPALMYLATSNWTTGQDILVDGGVSSWKHRGSW